MNSNSTFKRPAIWVLVAATTLVAGAASLSIHQPVAPLVAAEGSTPALASTDLPEAVTDAPAKPTIETASPTATAEPVLLAAPAWEPVTFVRSTLGDESDDAAGEGRPRWAVVDAGTSAVSVALRDSARPTAVASSSANTVRARAAYAALGGDASAVGVAAAERQLSRPAPRPRPAVTSDASVRPARSTLAVKRAASVVPAPQPVDDSDTVQIPYEDLPNVPVVGDAPRHATDPGWKPGEGPVEDVIVNPDGSISPAPEPATLVSIVGASAVLLRRRRRR